MADYPGFRLDVLREGQPIIREAEVAATGRGLEVDGEQIDFHGVFATAVRSGLMFVFGGDWTMVLQGAPDDIQELETDLNTAIDADARQAALTQAAGEGIVCIVGTAVTGTVQGTVIEGPHLALITRVGLHLLAHRHHYTVKWPVEEIRLEDPVEAGPAGPALRVTSPECSLFLHYLTAQEAAEAVEASRGAEGRAPPARADESDLSLGLFNLAEVAPAGSAGMETVAATQKAIPALVRSAVGRVGAGHALSPPHDRIFFKDHFTDLVETAASPLIAKLSQASRSDSLAEQIKVLDARQLRGDALAAQDAVAARTVRVFLDELGQVARDRRREPPGQEDPPVAAAREAIRKRMAGAASALGGAFDDLQARQALLEQRLGTRDLAPLDADDAELKEALDEWGRSLEALDRSYAEVWSDVVLRLAEVWSEVMLPALGAWESLPRRGGPWTRTIAVAVFLSALAVAGWLMRHNLPFWD